MSENKTGLLQHFFYSQKMAPYVFVLPFLLSFFLFFFWPSLQTIFMSFHRVYGLNNMEFIGLKNYARLNNIHFFNAVRTNTIYVFFCICTIIPVSLILAVLLNTKFIHGRNVFRAIVFIPSLTSVIVAGVAFRLIFGSLPSALANWFLSFAGIGPVNWTMNAWSGMVILLFLVIWRITGIYMIYFLSALQAIPEELYESADIDGAGTVGKFFRITLPLVKPTSIYVLTLVVFEGYRMFSESFVFWQDGNPGDIGLTITRYIYQEAFHQNDMGFGSAIGITMLFIVLLINLIQLNSFGLFKKDA
ncbi:L-arabinose transport system permease protein AraP [Spirochaetia bacterium]|nr:L-arabinose transport system permease protein AraP [Spirochaetia bacterium]